MLPSVYFKTYGCAFNQLDSEVMIGFLQRNGYVITSDLNSADIVVINSCTVKNSAETKLFNDIKRFKSENKKIVVCGCVPQAEPSYLKTKLKDITVLGINELDKICSAVDKTYNGDVLQNLSDLSFSNIKLNRCEKENLRLNSYVYNIDSKDELQKKSKNIIGIVPINEGCLNHCTYCKTKYARGSLFSYSIMAIKEAVENKLKNGITEIYLTSQDTACYGYDIGCNLVDLLKEILTIKMDFKIRIGMGNPNLFLKIIDDILSLMLKDKRIYRFLHIPIQSGNDRILKQMRRPYTVNDYKLIVNTARAKIPNITIANDIIVGYPTETQAEFYETLKLVDDVKFNVLNFSRFWLRPNTIASKIYVKTDFVDGLESKKRAIELKERFEKIALINNSEWIGFTGYVKIIENGKIGTDSVIARNDYYKPIVINNAKKNKLKIGDIVKVRITDVTWFDFRSELV